METKLPEERQTLELADVFIIQLTKKVKALALDSYAAVDASRSIKYLLEVDKMKAKQLKGREVEQAEKIYH